jgi:hypothetical protein
MLILYFIKLIVSLIDFGAPFIIIKAILKFLIAIFVKMPKNYLNLFNLVILLYIFIRSKLKI